jgi:hypothetical protein
VTQDDGRASLSLVAKASPGVGVCFVHVGTSESFPMQTTGGVWFGTICKSSVESMWRVDRVFPYRVYIDSIRITATLGYEYRLFVAVIT